MEFINVVENRRSIRAFLPDPVPKEDIEEIIRIGTRAPSAGNKQEWHFIAVTDSRLKERMKKAVQDKAALLARRAGEDDPDRFRHRHTMTLFAQAPVALAVLTQPYRSLIDRLLDKCGYTEAEIDYLRMRPDLQTMGAVIQSILLAAYSLNYGGCWMVAPNIARYDLEDLLGVERPWSLSAIVALGRPDQEPKKKKIKLVTEVLEFREDDGE